MGAGEVLEVLTLRAGYNTTVVIVGTMLLGLAGGIVGVFALLRERALTTDALSHATLPGIAAAFLAWGAFGGEGRPLVVLLIGAAATGVLGVLCIQGIIRWTRLREDAAIGIVLGVFFGAGVVGLSYIQANASGGSGGLNGLIYGQAATMRAGDVYLMGGIVVVCAALVVVMMRPLTLTCFDEGFARMTGWRVGTIDVALMSLIVLVTVAGIQSVGLILVVAMLIIPAVAARFWTDRVRTFVFLAGGLGALSGYLGSVLSSLLPRQPAGAVIVLLGGAIFVVSMLCAPRRGVLAGLARRVGLSLRIAGEHVLEDAHDRGAREVGAEDLARIGRAHGWSGLKSALVVRSLVLKGFLERSGRGAYAISARGRERGARISRNHTLWERYLVRYADIAPSHVDWTVDQVEHVLSPELIAELDAIGERAGVARGV